jgi:hypothetical protein
VEPPRYPRVESDLDAWHVYADWLIERGDPAGAHIAFGETLERLATWSARKAAPRPPPTAGRVCVRKGEGGDGEGAKKSRNKVKYTCPTCAANVWGKPGLALACLGAVDGDAIHDAVLLVRAS